MLSIIKSMAINGVNGYQVSVQVDVTKGLPKFEIVGLPDVIVKESKERVRIAIKNSGYEFYNKRIIVNLAPVNTRKVGSIFDLPIAVGILKSLNIIKNNIFSNYIIVGELSLDGKIKKIEGALAICIEISKYGIKNILLPKENEKDVCIIDKINIIFVSNLKEVVDFFNGIINIKKSIPLKYENLLKNFKYNLDFSDVYGQNIAKRVLEISAAGGHNCLMIGCPGSGKTMLAKRLPTILPELTLNEALEVTKIHSLYNENNDIEGIIVQRPFRAPHHTISEKALIGGGDIPKPRRSYFS